MRIRFLFHTGKGPNIKNGKWRWLKAKSISAGIITWTSVLAIIRLDFKALKYNFSHVEVWFPDKDAGFLKCYDGIDLLRAAGECFSSTTRGDAEGIRFIDANKLLKHPERWDYIECEVEKGKFENTMVEGLFGFFSPWNIHDKKKWYCSELCAELAFWWGLLPLYGRISPRRLASKLAKKYGEPVRLFAGYAVKGKKWV